MKKFEPWIQKADAKRAVGMLKPKNLQEALDQLEGANVSFSKQHSDLDCKVVSKKYFKTSFLGQEYLIAWHLYIVANGCLLDNQK